MIGDYYFFFKKWFSFIFSFWKEGRKEEAFGSSYCIILGFLIFFFDRTQACTLFFFFSLFLFSFFFVRILDRTIDSRVLIHTHTHIFCNVT